MKKIISWTLILLLLFSNVGEAAVLNLCGFESGASSERSTDSGTFSVQSTTKRTGNYALRINTSTTGFHRFNQFATDGNTTNMNAADVYVRFYMRVATAPAANTENVFQAHDNTNVKLELRLNSSRQLVAYDTALSVLGTGATALSLNTWYRIEVRVGTGAAATYEVKIDGVSELSGTGNLSTTNNARVDLGRTTNRNSQATDIYYDDFLIDDATYPGAGQIVALTPDGDGNAVTWTIGAGAGNDWENVDEVPADDDTTYLLSTLSVGQASTVSLISSTAASISGTIKAVKAFVRTKRDGAANGTFQLRLRSNTTNSDGANAASGSTYGVNQLIHAVDPATSAAWAVAALDSVEVGVEEAEATDRTRWTASMVMVDFEPAAAPASGSKGALMLRRVGE
jgi:hypothetical protein